MQHRDNRQQRGSLCGNRVTEYTNGNPRCERRQKPSLVRGQRTSSRWWLVSVHLIWPRLSAIISFHAATLASGTRKASYSVSDLWNRWFRSIDQAHRNFDPSLSLPPGFPFSLSFFLSFSLCLFRVDFRVDFTGPGEFDREKLRTNSFVDDFEAQMTDGCSTWLSFSCTTLRFYFATFHRSAIHRFLFRRQPLESGFHRSFNWIPYRTRAFFLFVNLPAPFIAREFVPLAHEHRFLDSRSWINAKRGLLRASYLTSTRSLSVSRRSYRSTTRNFLVERFKPPVNDKCGGETRD